MKFVNRLKNVALFDGLRVNQLRTLSRYLTEVKYPRSTVIFREGERGHTLYIILEGKVRIEHIDPVSRRRNILAILSAGDCFGEIAVVTNTGRTAAARTLGAAHLLVTDEESFLRLIKEYPSIARNIMKSMAVKLYETNRIIENLVFKTLRGRLAAKLLDLAEKFGTKKKNGVEIGLTLSHFDLAELVGTNRETVTKMLRDFRSEGSLEVHKRMFLITDEEKLRAWIN